MKKRGFTLVELLAVIAILAIVVIMALPAVLRMFNQARIDTFSNEINTILRTAKQQYLLEGGNAQTWTNADGSTNKLPLTGNSKLKYYVKMNGNGQITKLQVTNGEYQYSKSGIVEDVVKDDIKIVSELSEDDKLVIDGSGNAGTKTAKFVTNKGSFSDSETVQEMNLDIIDDGYTYTYEHSNVGWGTWSTQYNIAYIQILNPSIFNSDSYIEVYDESNNLIKRIDNSVLPERRMSLTSLMDFANSEISFRLGDYERDELRVVLSPDLLALESTEYIYMISFTNYLDSKTYSGPWVDSNSSSADAIRKLRNSVSGYYLAGFSRNEEDNSFVSIWLEANSSVQ